jgi:hypothetical protein
MKCARHNLRRFVMLNSTEHQTFHNIVVTLLEFQAYYFFI